jgi:predicted GNAT family N-acyltransferase
MQVLALESGGKTQGISEGDGASLRRSTLLSLGRHWPERIHGSVRPADVRPGDPVSAELRPPDRPDLQLPSRVWRISPLGVELVRPQELPSVLLGTPLDLTLRIGSSVSDFRALPLLATATERGHELLAFSWGQPPRPDPTDRPRRTSRWACEPEYAPTGIAPSAVRYEDFVYFRVVDVSWRGMQLETSLRNTFLVPGVELQSTCTFPTQGQVHLDLRVVHVRVVQRGQKKVLAVGVTYTSRSPASVDTIGQYLLRFGSGTTVQELCAEGFRIRSSSRALDFGSIRTAEEYNEVLRLRRLAYVHAKKISADAKDVDMADAYDARSRILVAKHRGRVVATARLMFPESTADRLNHEDFLEIPPLLPPREQMVEVFKTCTHPGYRGSDLFYTLLMHVGLVILQSGRRYALMSATDSLAPVYERFGFRRSGASYQHPSMRLRHHLMVLDVAGVVAGAGINPIFWNLVGGWELWNFGKLCGIVATDRWTRVRVRLWRLLRPVARVARMLYERRLRARGIAS